MIMNSLPGTRRPQVTATSSRSSSIPEEKEPIKHNWNRGMLGNEGPQQIFNIYAAPPLPPSFCSDDPYLKRSIARFKRELSDGYYTKVWQDKAKRAHEERMDGKFDEYLTEHAEEMFLDEEEEGDEPAIGELVEESGDEEYQDGSRKRRVV